MIKVLEKLYDRFLSNKHDDLHNKIKIIQSEISYLKINKRNPVIIQKYEARLKELQKQLNRGRI